MTDAELIEALRSCSEYHSCDYCPLGGEIDCTTIAADRLESAIGYGNDMYQEVQLQICKREQSFSEGAMAMQEVVLDLLSRMAENTKGVTKSTIQQAMKKINDLEVDHEQ